MKREPREELPSNIIDQQEHCEMVQAEQGALWLANGEEKECKTPEILLEDADCSRLQAESRDSTIPISPLIAAAPTVVKFHRLVLIVLAMMVIIVVSILH